LRCAFEFVFSYSGLRTGLILLALVNERLVNVRDHTTASNGSLDKGVKLLVTTNGELKMTRRDALHLQILGGVACKLEHLCGQVFEDCCAVYGCGGTNATVLVDALLQEAVDTTDWELKASLGGA